MGSEQSTQSTHVNVDKLLASKNEHHESQPSSFSTTKSKKSFHSSKNGTNDIKGEYQKKDNRNKVAPPKLTGFALVQFKCRAKKALYQQCHDKRHKSFLVGKESDVDCDDLFEAYKRCIFIGMKRDRQRRGLGSPKEGSALAEFEEEEDNNYEADNN